MQTSIPKEALTGSVADFRNVEGRDLLDRWAGYLKWWETKRAYGLDPYSRSTSSRIATTAQAFDSQGLPLLGAQESINFASQEYLSLASHPQVLQAAQDALWQYGAHSAGSAVLMGTSAPLLELEQMLAKFLHLSEATVFPTGWGAGYGVVKTLVTPNDFVVIDKISHACLIEGAVNATKNVLTFKNNDTSDLERVLRQIRTQSEKVGILVVTESLFSTDSTVPDIRKTQQLVKEFGATLVLDVAHDLGSLAPFGGGALETQQMMGQVDVVMGSFSKTFASNGGFVASNHPALRQALRPFCGTLAFSNAFSPIQAAVVLETLKIIQSEEGSSRRVNLMQNTLYLRQQLEVQGFEVLGQPSAIVPVLLGDSITARLMTKFMLENGVLVNMVEFPAVSRTTNRWRVQMMADHTSDQIDVFVDTAIKAKNYAKQILD
jgi:glycine C-acetyltransferase